MQSEQTNWHALALALALPRGLRIDPPWLEAVADNLALLHYHAERFMQFAGESTDP